MADDMVQRIKLGIDSGDVAKVIVWFHSPMTETDVVLSSASVNWESSMQPLIHIEDNALLALLDTVRTVLD